jgi:hypothetical protein
MKCEKREINKEKKLEKIEKKSKIYIYNNIKYIYMW